MTDQEKKIRGIDADGFNKFIDEFKNESDRAAVILGAAKLDLLLNQILEQYFLPNTSGKDELLDGDSPLGTFSAKISITYRLGSEFTRLLQLVRKIRNAFAHEVSGCSLESGAHRDRVKELVAQIKHKNIFIALRSVGFGGADSPTANFRTALAFMVGRLEYLLNHIETTDSSNAICILDEHAKSLGEIENPMKTEKQSKRASKSKD